MLNIPNLFQRNDRTLALTPNYTPLAMHALQEWVAMEILPGADVRVTVRKGSAVRLEVIQRPSEPQRREGIINPWYRDAKDEIIKSADLWLWKGLKNTDCSPLPDGEWEGECVGPKIRGNPLNLEEPKIIFSSLFPWSEEIPGLELPPDFGRTPFGFDDLRYFLLTTHSKYTENAPLEGLLWWWGTTPMAQVRAKDFPRMFTAPNPEAEVELPVYEDNPIQEILDAQQDD